MNGARSIFMRKGYWLTALAAIVLLTLSAGTAAAQEINIKSVAVDAATSSGDVAEGITTRVTVTLTEALPSTVTAGARVDVELQATPGNPLGATGAAGIAESGDFTLAAAMVDIAAGQDSGSVVLITHHDVDAVDEGFQILADSLTFTDTADPVAATQGTDTQTFTGKIDDDEVQGYDLTVTETAANRKEGAPLNLKVSANPTRPTGEDVNDLYFVAPGYTIDPATAQMVSAATAKATPSKENDGNRTDDPVTISVLQGTVVNNEVLASLTITVLDIHQLPTAITGEAKDEKMEGEVVTTVKEGGKAYLFVTVVNSTDDRIFDGEEFTLTPNIDASNGLDATITPAFMKFKGPGSMDGKKVVGPFTIEAAIDEDVGVEYLTVSLDVDGDTDSGGGSSSGTFSIGIEDETAKKITPKASEADYDRIKAAIAAGGGDEGLNPGDTVELMTRDLFTVEDGYTASYGVSVEGDSASASASGETVTINALLAGESKITVTGTARMASSSLIPTQTVSNVAELTFPVMVVDTELVVTLSAEPMEIAAGGTTMITATANRDVTAGDGAVAIALAVVPSDGGTLDPESIMITMGDMSGYAMLTANESVTVVASGSGVTGLMQVMVTVTGTPPEPVPALPLLGQLLLGLGLLGGGARQLFRRRRQG